jgi:hypothetical protein
MRFSHFRITNTVPRKAFPTGVGSSNTASTQHPRGSRSSGIATTVMPGKAYKEKERTRGSQVTHRGAHYWGRTLCRRRCKAALSAHLQPWQRRRQRVRPRRQCTCEQQPSEFEPLRGMATNGAGPDRASALTLPPLKRLALCTSSSLAQDARAGAHCLEAM